MGKREVRIIVIRKGITGALLVLVSAAMIALLFYLSGKAYASGTEPLAQLLIQVMTRQQSLNRNTVLAEVMPALANVLFYIPWGFLAFLLFDSPARPRSRTYVIAVIAGATFAATMQVWQSFLPTRVTGLLDAFANTLGTFAGALAGHLRKTVRFQFEG
ncbi:MAG TPA: VanZ family protein [Thermoanaerobaculia bacterium]|nr:VanZ family protein [Thermoanaerobaculia bacterium]